MTCLLQIDFPFTGPWAQEMSAQLEPLAQSIADEPGLIWKIWTENREASRAGGIYLFADPDAAQTYLTKHESRLREAGVPFVEAKFFDVNAPLSRIDRGPI